MVATRFAVAVHILLLVASRSGDEKATSEIIARSIDTNPVVVRRITGQLARAGLVRVRRGPGGAALARPPAEITLGDVWRAMRASNDRPLLPLHSAAHQCPGAREVRGAFAAAERALERTLGHRTLASLTDPPLDVSAAAD